jgi:hypothetical protein
MNDIDNLLKLCKSITNESLSSSVYIVNDGGHFILKVKDGICPNADFADVVGAGNTLSYDRDRGFDNYVSFTIMDRNEVDGPSLQGNKTDDSDPYRVAFESTKLSALRQLGEVRYFICDPMLYQELKSLTYSRWKDLIFGYIFQKYIPLFARVTHASEQDVETLRNKDSVESAIKEAFPRVIPEELSESDFISLFPDDTLSFFENKPRRVDLRPEIKVRGRIDIPTFLKVTKGAIYTGKSGSFEVFDDAKLNDLRVKGAVARLQTTLSDQAIEIANYLKSEFGSWRVEFRVPDRNVSANVCHIDFRLSKTITITIIINFFREGTYNPGVRFEQDGKEIPGYPYRNPVPIVDTPFRITKENPILDREDYRVKTLMSNFKEALKKLIFKLGDELA